MNIKEALQVILNDTEHYGTSLNYAVNYCRAATLMKDGSEELRVQCLYILSNIEHWTVKQNKLVKEVKAALKREGK